jgi:hypothetical protein
MATSKTFHVMVQCGIIWEDARFNTSYGTTSHITSTSKKSALNYLKTHYPGKRFRVKRVETDKALTKDGQVPLL